MQTKSTTSIIALCMMFSAMIMLSSCSTSNMLSSDPHYRLNLVKAGKPTQPVTAKSNNTDQIAPMPQYGSLVSYSQSNKDIKQLTELLKSDVKQVEKQVKKSSPAEYKKLKSANINKAIKLIASPRSKSSKNSVQSVNNVNDQTYDLMRDPKGLFYIWIILLGVTIAMFALALVSSIFVFLGIVVGVAFLIFLFLWILSAAKVPERVS